MSWFSLQSSPVHNSCGGRKSAQMIESSLVFFSQTYTLQYLTIWISPFFWQGKVTFADGELPPCFTIGRPIWSNNPSPACQACHTNTIQLLRYNFNSGRCGFQIKIYSSPTLICQGWSIFETLTFYLLPAWGFETVQFHLGRPWSSSFTGTACQYGQKPRALQSLPKKTYHATFQIRQGLN